MNYEWFISLRYLKAKRRQSFISLITWISIGGVAVGVCALIVVMAVMTGAQDDMKKKILGANSHILVTNVFGTGFKHSDKVAEDIRKIEGVTHADPYGMGQAMLTSENRITGVVLRGVVSDPPAESTDIEKYMQEGSLRYLDEKFKRVSVELDELDLEQEVERRGIVLGNELAAILQVGMGDPITVVSPVGKVTPGGMAPSSRFYYVCGIFKSGMYEYDSTLAIVSLQESQKLFRMGEKATGVEVKTKDIYDTGSVVKRIKKKLGYPYAVRDWQELNANLFFALKLEKSVIGIILTLIVCVAAFNIVSTLIMVVMEKTKDVAVLKAMGASRKSVVKIFFLEGLVIGLSGTGIGDIGGIVLCKLLEKYKFITLPKDVYNMDTLPVALSSMDVVTVSMVAVAVTVVATIYPAWQAGKLDPVEALRYE